jgi:hypothetical protein
MRGDPVPVGPDDILWGFRTVVLHGRVVLPEKERSGAADLFSRAQVDLRVTGSADESLLVFRGPAADPWNQRWMDRSGLHTGLVSGLDREGTFTLRVPQVRGTSVRVRLPGWRVAFGAVPVGIPDGEARTLAIPVERATTVEGQLRFDAGPLPKGVLLKAYVLGTTDLEKVTLEGLRARGEAVGIVRGPDGIAYQRTSHPIKVTPQGTFTLQLPTAGRIQLVAHVPGAAPARLAFDSPESSPQSVVLTAVAPVGGSSRVVVLEGGTPLTRGVLMLSDITDHPMQSSIEITLDEAGAMPGEWLETGRRYWAVGSGSRGRDRAVSPRRGRATLEWNGGSELNLESVSR